MHPSPKDEAKHQRCEEFCGLRNIYKVVSYLGSMVQRFNVVIEQGEDGYLVSEVVELPGCHTQAKTMDELIKRTKEAISLYLRCKKPSEVAVKFLGLQQIEIEA